MGLLQKLMHGVSKDKEEFKEKFKQAENESRINKMLEERSKSSNRRELERYMREQEEADVKKMLDKIHKKQNKDNWSSPNKVLGGKATMMKTDRPILKEKNIFVDKKNKVPLQNKREGMFFRW